MEQLNKKQEECVNTLKGPVLVLAAAGTGKTRVIIQRFLNLLESGIFSNQILCITFSNKAASEILKRLNQAIEIKNLWIGTFHKICIRILQITNNLPKHSSIIDESDQRKIFDALGIIKYLHKIQIYKEDQDLELNEQEREAYEKYQTYLEENNYLDFGEIILLTIRILENNENQRQYIRKKFPHIMIDEFQDTSKTQNKLLYLLTGENKNIFCVGDDDQCIYEWRGAYSENINLFLEQYSEAKVIRLEQNYRSTIAIVKTANSLIKKNQKRMEKHPWTSIKGDKVRIIYSFNEGQYIAKTIKELNGSVGILLRSSNGIGEIENALSLESIPYKTNSSQKFLEKKEIKVLLSYLKFIVNEDLLSLENIINFPRRGVGLKKLTKIKECLKSGTWKEALLTNGLEHFYNQILDWKDIESPTLLIDKIMEDTLMFDIFKDSEIQNIEILKTNALKHNSLGDFLNSIWNEDFEVLDPISILTVHASKGLEFDYVFVPFLTEGQFPHIRAIETNQIEAERRLAYVAFTRAKKALFLVYNLETQRFKNIFGPSRFLSDLDNNFIKYEVYK